MNIEISENDNFSKRKLKSGVVYCWREGVEEGIVWIVIRKSIDAAYKLDSLLQANFYTENVNFSLWLSEGEEMAVESIV